MPRMLPASSRTSSIDLASLTPPPLPRPPAWICAFTTQTPSSSASAALTASSTEKAGMPRGVGMPKRRKISLPWYSWIFTPRSPTSWSSSPRKRGPRDVRRTTLDSRLRGNDERKRRRFAPSSRRSAVPLRIVAADGIGRRLERVTAIELKGFVLARLDLAPQSGEHLDRGGRRVRQQFGDMAAAAHAAHRVVEGLAKAVQQARAGELPVRCLDAIACAFVRHAVGADVDGPDDEVGANGHARPHVVHGHAGRSQPREQCVVVILDVGQMAFEIE